VILLLFYQCTIIKNNKYQYPFNTNSYIKKLLFFRIANQHEPIKNGFTKYLFYLNKKMVYLKMNLFYDNFISYKLVVTYNIL
jgi:hypothetical protein